MYEKEAKVEKPESLKKQSDDFYQHVSEMKSVSSKSDQIYQNKEIEYQIKSIRLDKFGSPNDDD